MRLLITALFIFFINSSLSSQSFIKDCSDKKKESLNAILEQYNKGDTAGITEKFVRMMNDWGQCLIGKPINELSLETLSGQIFDEKSFKGKVVIINFWFTGCASCIIEMPALNRLVKEFHDSSVIFIGLTFDSKAKLEPFLEKVKFDFSIVGDSKDIIDLFGVNGYPTTIAIDKSQIIRKMWMGGGATNELINKEAYEKGKSIISELLKAQ